MRNSCVAVPGFTGFHRFRGRKAASRCWFAEGLSANDTELCAYSVYAGDYPPVSGEYPEASGNIL